MVDELPPVLLKKLEELRERAHSLEREAEGPDLLKNPARSKPLFQELGKLRKILALAERMTKSLVLLREAEACIQEGSDPELVELSELELPELVQGFNEAKEELLTLLLTGDKFSDRNAILELRAGTGGDEAALFVRDLAKIYARYCERMQWKMKTLSITENDVGGFKEAVFSIEGSGVFQYMRFEMGGHRVQRVPSTETQGRIHTSAATVAVLPEAEEVEVKIDDRDLEIQTTTSSGPGGQHVNKTESAVRMTHKPTGIVVFCQEERSQHKNKAKALKLIKARVLDHERRKADAARSAERKSQIGSGDRSQRIRTYNFPQNRVTDHRTQQNYSLTGIVDGQLGQIIKDLLLIERDEKLRDL